MVLKNIVPFLAGLDILQEIKVVLPGLHRLSAHWVHSHNCAHSVHSTSVMHTQESCTVLIPLCKNNLKLSISLTPLCFKKIRTTTIAAFLIFNTVVPNHYINNTVFNSFSFKSHKFKVHLIELSQSDVQILYSL